MLFLILFLIFLIVIIIMAQKYKLKKNKPIIAIAVFNNDITGTVKFTEEFNPSRIKIDLNLKGLKKGGYHGFHVHEAGDLTENCISACAHFNPYNKNHGCPDSSERHVGDLGNIKTDENGNANYTFYDNVITLNGSKYSIIGRGLVIHEDMDDCGNGNNEESKKTGNSGKRIACAVIGYSKNNFV